MYIPFALFSASKPNQKNQRTTLLIVFSDFVLNRNIQRTNHRRIEIEDEIVVVFETGTRVLLLTVPAGREGCWESGDICSDVMTLLTVSHRLWSV